MTNKEIEDFINTTNINIYRTFCPMTSEYKFFSNAHWLFTRGDHMLGHKTNQINIK